MRICLVLMVLAVMTGLSAGRPAWADDVDVDKLPPEQVNFFESKIRPVLVRECYGCHSTQTGNAKGGLRLDTARLVQLGGDSGPAITPGDPDDSLLLSAMRYEAMEMPPRGPLADHIVDDFETWIRMGAVDPRITKPVVQRSAIPEETIQSAKATFWGYQPPRRQTPPVVSDSSWPETVVDQFILAGLESQQMEPSPDAKANQVLRRLTFDLHGLPPTPEQLFQFAKQWKSSPQKAVNDQIDRLLESDRFGERFGRHWLDVARYAESTGKGVNMTYP
ncbi:MAG: DUF1549 domain-containing protein, partial [Planctomycetota bacterium]